MAEYRFLTEPDVLFCTMPYSSNCSIGGINTVLFALSQLRRNVSLQSLKNYNYGYMYKDR